MGKCQPGLGFFSPDRHAPYVHDQHRPERGVRDYCCWRCAMTDRIIRWSTVGAVVGVAAVARSRPNEHGYALMPGAW